MDSSLIKDLKNETIMLYYLRSCVYAIGFARVYCAITRTCLATTFVINEEENEEREREREQKREKKSRALYSTTLFCF